MEWARTHFGIDWAPNTREAIRRQTLHHFLDAGIVELNPDEPGRPTNSPRTVYRATTEFTELAEAFGGPDWSSRLQDFLALKPSLAERYAKVRRQQRVPLVLPGGEKISLSAGMHSRLIRDVVGVFGPRFVPAGELLYVGDTGQKWGFFAEGCLTQLGVRVKAHGKMPDVVIHCRRRNCLLLVEAVTSHGPVDPKRHGELQELFQGSTAGLVFVTAFPDRLRMAKYLPEIAWETEVWVASSPTHLIHFDGERFLGPY